MLFSVAALSALVATTFAAPAAEPVDLERRATPVNYNQNYIASGAGVTYTPNLSAGSFSVNYNTKADFVVGLGWSTGSTAYVCPSTSIHT